MGSDEPLGRRADSSADPFLWLEDIDSDDALDWVRGHNDLALAELGSDRFEEFRAQALEVLDTDTRIPYVTRRDEYLYNLWRDAEHPRGLWRRTTLEQYRTADPDWDVLIDLDGLGRADNESWVWGGVEVIRPEATRALVRLSRGGSDAAVVREFDMATREFVSDGFTLPEAKTDISWEDEDTVLVGTDFGEGSLTDSGYPRVIKRWRRGSAIADAETLFSGSTNDVLVGASVDRTPGFERTLIQRAVDFFNTDTYELRSHYCSSRKRLIGAELIRIDAPTDAVVGVHRNWLLMVLKTDWLRGGASYAAGSLLVADYEEFLSGTAELHVVFTPDARTSFTHSAWTRDQLVFVTLADVASRVEVVTPGAWRVEQVPGIPEKTDTIIVDTDPTGDEIFLNSSGFTAPSRLLHGAAQGPLDVIKAAPPFFEADDLEVTQRFATSADGTSIPYFVVGRSDSSGPLPTLLDGYGGFEVSNTPGYDGVLGRLWLARGGNYVMANIRGGGEYGPTWHQQAQREHRHRAFEDFAAVAKDVVAQGITTVQQLGARGGSNGGLLVGVMLTRYPDLFGALVCSVPLLDMRRFHLMLAGASWMAEYGNPDDPADWEFLEKYSPYHNISGDRAYPALLMTTSTRDDRVHPGHARKMVAALEAAGHGVRYYENIEGGHAGAADNAQAAFRSALIFEFLWRTIGAA